MNHSISSWLADLTAKYSTFQFAAYVSSILIILGIYYSIPETSRGKILPGTPIVGLKSIFEPAWFTKLRLTFQGWSMSHEGWVKVSRERQVLDTGKMLIEVERSSEIPSLRLYAQNQTLRSFQIDMSTSYIIFQENALLPLKLLLR
jgi:hypothetical protein